MSLFHNSVLAGASGQGGAYEIERSLRFNNSDSAYLSRTPASAGNRRTFTWSGWIKRSKLGLDGCRLFVASSSGSDIFLIRLQTADVLNVVYYNGTNYGFLTVPVYRDVSAWYHVLVSIDTTQATAADRFKLYINGERVTTLTNLGDIPQNTDLPVNNTVAHAIGNGGGNYYDGYLADIHFIDGQALDPTSFGEFDTNGIWQPKAYTGTYGTNGFHLAFADNSAATATTLGKDTSGNGNNWTPNNLTAVEANYTARTSLTGTIYPGAGGVSKIFDGTTATCGPDNGSYATFTPSAPIPINTSLRVRANVSNTSVDANFQINGSPRSTVSLGFPASGSIVNAASTWVTITSPPSSLTSLTFGWTGSWMAVSGIEIDGTVLVDSVSDSLVDTPTSYGTDTGVGGEVRGNYATLNGAAIGADATISNGNLDIVYGTSTTRSATMGTIGMSSGKWYWEITITATVTVTPATSVLGVTNTSVIGEAGSWVGANTNGWGYYGETGYKYNNNSGSSYGASYTTNDVIGFAFDADAGSITAYKNGVSQGVMFSSLPAGTYFPAVSDGSSYGGFSASCNFGQRPFAYTAPSGYKALCTTNLPDPVVAQPSTVMDVKLYTGNGTSQTISGLGFSPDFVWLKSRGAAYNHQLFDTIRGTGKQLYSNSTSAETTESFSWLNAFNSDGFGVTGAAGVNDTSDPMVAWAWDAGSSTVTNTQGSITSTVRANASAGFSIVTYTGTGSNATVGHGLGVAPRFIILKSRSNALFWYVYAAALNNPNQYLLLNVTDSAGSASVVWNNTAPTSTTFSIGTDTGPNTSGATYVAYCFAPVAGYSSFGSYTGNGSTDGPFVYTGFLPKFLLVKSSTNAGSAWTIVDGTRDSANTAYNNILFPNYSDAENAGANKYYDFTSNGFKVRGISSAINASGATLVYAAFAESPLQYSRAR